LIRTFTFKLFFFISFSVQTFLWIQPAFAQKSDTCNCNYNCWRSLSETNYKYSENELILFLRTISSTCHNNVEFSEFSNETLFKLVENNPSLFLKVMTNEKLKLEIEIINNVLENPVHDLLNLKDIYSKIEKVKPADDKTKEKVLAALKIAISKYEN
jgi:hypothetical protein